MGLVWLAPCSYVIKNAHFITALALPSGSRDLLTMEVSAGNYVLRGLTAFCFIMAGN